jgi:hypothetical protein
MRGSWLAKFGRWIARQETFEKMVAPAISDMQVEASFGRLHLWKHYVAIGLVLIHALFQDLHLDSVSAFGAESRRLVWKHAAIWYAGSVAFMTFIGFRYNLPQGLSLAGIWPAALTSALLDACVTGLGLAVTVGVFYLYRRGATRRSIVVVSLIAAALSVAVALAVRPVRISADQVIYASIGNTSSYWQAKLDPQIGWWKDIQSGIRVIPNAILAVVLARRKGWRRVTATVIFFFLSWVLEVILWDQLVLRPLLSEGRYQPPSEIMQGWREFAFSLVLASVWLTIDNFFRRYRLYDPS